MNTESAGIYHHYAAGFPAVAVETVEEERLQAAILDLFSEEEEEIPVWRYSATGDLFDLRSRTTIRERISYQAAFAQAAERLGEGVLIVYDAQHVLRNAPVYRALRDALPEIKRAGGMVVLVAPQWILPAEVAHEVPVIAWDLPTREQLAAALDVTVEGLAEALEEEIDLTPEERAALLDAASGLTLSEAEGAFALSAAAHHQLLREVVERKKLDIIRSTGYLSVAPAADMAEIGGLGGLREYVEAEVVPVASDDDLRVRGVLLVGVPGTGKSLAAKALGSRLGWPTVRLDLAAVKGSLVGESERNMRHALATVDAIAPCVLWLDEIEKAVGGYASSARTDSGVTLGIVGALLTWMQEHQSPVTVVATCNDYTALPPDLTRAGRFDERFFVDLPSQAERAEIAAVHLIRFGCEDAALAALVAEVSDGWTGAEIEQAVRSAARRTRRQIDEDALRVVAAEVRPISRTRAEEIRALREWAHGALRLANTTEAPKATSAGRKIRKGVRRGK